VRVVGEQRDRVTVEAEVDGTEGRVRGQMQHRRADRVQLLAELGDLDVGPFDYVDAMRLQELPDHSRLGGEVVAARLRVA
jgi:hypothetical protein